MFQQKYKRIKLCYFWQKCKNYSTLEFMTCRMCPLDLSLTITLVVASIWHFGGFSMDWCWGLFHHRLFWNFFTNNKINNFEVSPHHCSNQKLVYSPARCAKCLLTWHIAWNYLHVFATRASSTGENIVCRLNKSVGFQPSKTDYSLFTRQNNSSFIAFPTSFDWFSTTSTSSSNSWIRRRG